MYKVGMKLKVLSTSLCYNTFKSFLYENKIYDFIFVDGADPIVGKVYTLVYIGLHQNRKPPKTLGVIVDDETRQCYIIELVPRAVENVREEVRENACKRFYKGVQKLFSKSSR